MLKTLIVDDERLIRAELRQVVDWKKYGIEIIGEAENGRNAMQILEQQHVDLMFTDLSMPGLSGMDFLQAVRERFPSVQIVITTVHQNFDYIQQALRMGVVDYITKTRIEQENFGSILEDILKRLPANPGLNHFSQDRVRFLCRIAPGAEPGPGVQKLYEGIWTCSCEAPELRREGILEVAVSGLQGMHYREGVSFLRKYMDKELFYLYRPDCYAYSCSFCRYESHSDKWDLLSAEVQGTEWILDEDRYAYILSCIPTLQLTRDELTVFLYQPFLKCASYLMLGAQEFFTQTRNLQWWYQWEQWLTELRRKTAAVLKPEDSGKKLLQTAVQYVNTHYMQNLDLAVMLHMTAMSKSLFCSGFKELTGRSFITYLKYIRVEHAKELLADTQLSVSEIALRVGYDDERYFRRVFTEIVGKSPASYRRNLIS